jgi:fluoride exporter
MMTWLLVACGGAIGATLRYALGLLFKPNSVFPWSTWWVNVFGCLLAGAFFALSQKYPSLQHEVRLLFMVGILGGFTTFSSFGLETFQLLKQGQIFMALAYVISSLVVGILLLALAVYLIPR